MVVLSHWLPEDRLVRALRADRLPGLWRHWIPRAGREVTGLCLGDGDHGWWHRPGSDACVLLDGDGLPDIGVWRLNSQEVWELTEALRDAAPAERAAMAAAAADDCASYETDPTEWFVERGLEGVRATVLAVVSIGTPGTRLAALAARHGIAVETIDARFAAEDDSLLGEAMDAVVGRLAHRSADDATARTTFPRVP